MQVADLYKLVSEFGTVLFLLFISIYLIFKFFEDVYFITGWPKFYEKIARKRANTILEGMGVDENFRKLLNRSINEATLDQVPYIPDYKARCITKLHNCLIDRQCTVGYVYPMKQNKFVDLLSVSLDRRKADEFARFLVERIKEDREDKNRIGIMDFTKIVGIKMGSPGLAIALSELLGKPLTVYRGKDQFKFNINNKELGTLFDGATPKANDRIIIVDDSTTGGRMVLDAIKDLRSLKCTVNVCLVVFEPIGKKAREQLEKQNVSLLSIVKFDVDSAQFYA